MKHAPLTARLSALACLLLAALTVWSLTACNGKHKRSYDDDDDEEEDEEEVVSTSPLQIDDELLNSFDPNVPFEQTGHSQPFRIKPREDMTVSADAGAFERNVQIRVTDVPAEKMNELDGMLEDSGTTMLFAYDLDAGLPSDSVIPGKYTVSIDLDKHGIPEELYPYFMMYRVAGDGSLQPLNVKITGHTATYMASQNSITLAAIAISAIKIGIAVGVVAYAYAHYPAIFQTARHFIDMGIWPSNWWKWDDAVYEYVKDDYGNFYVCYRYSMTENGDKAHEYVDKKNELKKLVKELRKKATERYDSAHPQRFRGWFDSKEEEEKRRIGREMEFYQLMAKNERVQELSNDPVLQTPKSVDDIIQGTKLANRYCRNVQHMKPLSYEYVTWLTPPLEAWNEEACRFQVPVFDPCIIVNYSNVVQNGTYKKDTYYKNLSTIAHETMHLYQMEYVVSAAFKDNCYLEATGALVEEYFTDWLIKTVPGIPLTNAFGNEAAKLMGYTERDHKELLSTPLGKKCPTYQGVSRVEHERGYMMADMLKYLWEKKPNPRDTLDFAKMMNRYAVNKGMLKSMQDIFGIDGDPAFAKYYEGFCQKYINEIETRQNSYRMMEAGDHLVMPDVEHFTDRCIMRVKNLGEKGSQKGYPFMVNTFRIVARTPDRFTPRKRYNLFAVASDAVKAAELKFTFFSGDKFTDDNMFFASPSQSTSPPYASAVVMTRPDSKDLTMGDDYYIDIVAFYQPDATPAVNGPSLDKQGLLVQPKCTPPAELKDKYLTGLQIVIENNKNGNMLSYIDKVKNWKDKFVATYGQLATDTFDIDINVRSRWYYDTPQGKRYYSPFTDVVHYRLQRDNEQQAVEQDTTQVMTGMDIEGDDDQGPVETPPPPTEPFFIPGNIDVDAYVESITPMAEEARTINCTAQPFYVSKPEERFVAHVTAKDGQFTATIPACHVDHPIEYQSDAPNRLENRHEVWNTPAFTVTGTYKMEGQHRGKAYYDLADVSMSSSGLFTYTNNATYDYKSKLTASPGNANKLPDRSRSIRDIHNIGFFNWEKEKVEKVYINVPIHISEKGSYIRMERREETSVEDEGILHVTLKVIEPE